LLIMNKKLFTPLNDDVEFHVNINCDHAVGVGVQFSFLVNCFIVSRYF